LGTLGERFGDLFENLEEILEGVYVLGGSLEALKSIRQLVAKRHWRTSRTLLAR